MLEQSSASFAIAAGETILSLAYGLPPQEDAIFVGTKWHCHRLV